MPIPPTGTPVGLEILVSRTLQSHQLPATPPASSFYSAVFNWSFSLETNVGAPPDFLLVFNVPGDMFPGGGIIRKVKDAELATVPGTTKIYFYVDNMETAMERIVKNGGKNISDKEPEGDKAFY
ncbi:hypothetical protein V1517DRAFT_342118 [Lipomyces orientalis]|uniref:Uncharacterized protein n=1 Tax=Lipomyces orientalis TaxID=1233043 RepID=A0ACC3TEC6_9ASCO